MANTQFFEKQYVNLGGVTTLFARGTGAATASLTGVKGNGVTSIVRTGVGLHTITLGRKFQGLLNLDGNVIDVTTEDDWEVTLKSDLTANQTIAIAVFKGGIAADLSTDEKLLLTIALQDTSVKPAGF